MSPGDVVALTLAPIEVSGDAPIRVTWMSGLFLLEEFWGVEPAAYVHEAGWFVRPVSDGPEDGRLDRLARWEEEHEDPVTFWISETELTRQAAPNEWAAQLVEERMIEIWHELEAKEEEAR